MKSYFQKLVERLTKREAALTSAIEAATTVEEVNRLRDERDDVRTELTEARAHLEALEDAPPAAATNQRGAFNTLQNGNPQQRGTETPVLESREYQEAFMNFVARGTAIPADLQARVMATPEYRAAATTAAEDAGVLVPTTVLNEIVKKLDSYGELYRKFRKLNVQGGIKIGILTLKPTAHWIGEGAGEDQKVEAKDSVSFSYYGIEVKIAQTLLGNIVSLDIFNNQFVQVAVEAIIAELERSAFTGDGEGKFLGILNDPRVPEENIIEMTLEEIGSYSAWKQKVFAKMKKAYRNGEFIMAQGTFDGYIDGMVDSVGQPIGRVNYGVDGSETYRFCGKNVDTVEDDVIAPLDSCAAGDVFAVFMKPSDYGVNSNMQLTTNKWIDRDNNKVKTQVIMICDGNLIDPNGVLILKLKESEAAEG